MKKLITLLLLCLTTGVANGQNNLQRPTSGNYVKGVEALNGGDAQTAYRYLNEEIHHHPDNGYAHCYMALVCNYFGNAELALQAADSGLSLLPPADTEYTAFAHYVRGMLYMNRHTWEKARHDLDAAVSLAPHDSDYRILRAQLSLSHDMYEEAFTDLAAALQANKEADIDSLMEEVAAGIPTPEMLARIARCYDTQDAPRHALKYIEMALLLKPDDASFYALRADAEYECGMYEKAAASYKEALRLDTKASKLCRMRSFLQKLAR